MKLNNISFPYPVLGVRDDVYPLLKEDCVQMEVSTTPDTYIFDVTLRQENADITKLIKEGYAEYSCEIDCQKAFLRECVSSPNETFQIVLPRRKVNGRINFNGYVSVKKPIEGYTNKGFNEDYEGFLFDMEPGDILVGFPQAHFDADIKFDKLQAAGSFMVIREDTTISDTRFDITGNKIEIVLPTPLFDIFRNGVGDKFMDIVHSSIVFNALCYALYNIEANSETLWARCINTRIDTEPELAQYKELDPLKVPALAQALLNDPYKRMFESLNRIQNSTNLDLED